MKENTFNQRFPGLQARDKPKIDTRKKSILSGGKSSTSIFKARNDGRHVC